MIKNIVSFIVIPSLMAAPGFVLSNDVAEASNEIIDFAQAHNPVELGNTEVKLNMNYQIDTSVDAIQASSQAKYNYEGLTIVVVPDPPPPPPPPVVTHRRATTVSRSVDYSHTGTKRGSDLVAFAKQFVGTPYVGGGKSPGGFDCSGFTSYVYGQFGISLSSSSGAQRGYGTVVSAPAPGDLIWSPGHVGIYVGNGQQIDAPRPGKTIQVRGIWQSNPTFLRLL